MASASSSGSPTRAPTRRRRRTRGGEAASRRAEESAHLVPRLHGPESDWLLYADALPLPPVASQSVLPLLLKPLRTGATVLHILARAPPDLAPAWLGGLHSVDLHPRRHGTAAGFRPRKRPQWVLHEVPELLLVLAVTGAAAAKATLSPAATHITLPSAQQAEADAGECRPRVPPPLLPAHSPTRGQARPSRTRCCSPFWRTIAGVGRAGPRPLAARTRRG